MLVLTHSIIFAQYYKFKVVFVFFCSYLMEDVGSERNID